jgi:hypothetical protein
MKYLLDMVHHNPGEPPFQTAFLDPANLVAYGYTGQVFKHINCIATFRALGEDFFPAGSEERAWLEPFTAGIEAEISAAKAVGLQVFFHIDLFVLPKRLIERFRDRLCDKNGRISLDQEFTLEVHRVLFEELFARYPMLDGFIIRHGETYLYDTPFHAGNGPIPLHGPHVEPEREHDRFVKLIGFLRETVCVRHNKTVIFRTWDWHPDKFHANADYYLAVTDRVEPHPNLVFSIKHTAMDFYRHIKANEALGRGRHPQIVEVQCQREFEGKGAYPNYVMDGVINGFEEFPKRIGLRDVVSNPLIQGVYTWSRGGGWYGPYLQDEFWPALNAFVISRWASHPDKTEEQIMKEFCHERLGLTDEDAAAFRRLCLLSARAVLKGRYCEVWDRTLNGIRTPVGLWMRDDRLGGLDQLAEVFAYLYEHDLFETALREKAEAVALWEEIASLMASIHFPDRALGERLATSVQYGFRLFRVVQAGWQVMALGYGADRAGIYSTANMRAAIESYDQAWKSYREVAGMPGAASLYHGHYFSLPGEPEVPGLNATVERYR